MITLRLIITKHARQQMFDRGIDEDQIIRAIERGAKTRQTDSYLVTYTYIKIAYKKIGKDYYKIKTVMLI